MQRWKRPFIKEGLPAAGCMGKKHPTYHCEESRVLRDDEAISACGKREKGDCFGRAPAKRGIRSLAMTGGRHGF